MTYSVFTLIHAVMSSTIFLSCLLIALFRRNRPMFVFAQSFACSTASAVLIALQTPDNRLFTTVLGNLLFIVANMLLFFGTQLFCDYGARWPRRFWLYLVLFAGYMVQFTLLQYDIIARSVAVAVFCTILFADFFIYLLPHLGSMLAPIRASFIVALLATEAAYIGRVVVVMTYMPAVNAGELSESLNTYVLVSHAITSILWLTTLILLDDAHLLEQLRQQNRILEPMAHTDRLTGLYNRNKLHALLSEFIQLAKRLQKPLSFIMVDIDHFKDVNDTYGHPVGDQTLVRLAEIIRRNIRSTDRAFRWGGEEFLILAVGTSAEGGAILAENLRRRVESEPFAVVGHITASFGVAEQLPQERFDSWFRRTDMALYQAKAAGRNRVMKSDCAILPCGNDPAGKLDLLPTEGFATSADHPARTAV